MKATQVPGDEEAATAPRDAAATVRDEEVPDGSRDASDDRAGAVSAASDGARGDTDDGPGTPPRSTRHAGVGGTGRDPSDAEGAAPDAEGDAQDVEQSAEDAEARLRVAVDELESRNARLRSDKRRSGREVKNLRDEVQGLTREVRRLTVELEKLRNPPHIVGTVADVLRDGRIVVKSTTGPNFVVPVADCVDRADIEPGTRVSLSQQNLTVVGLLPSGKDPVVRASELVERPETTYADVGGLEEVIEEVKEAVEYPLTRPEAYRRLGVTPPKGVLLRGPPGTGKTLVAKAVANATDATFLRLVGSELVQKFIGEGSRRVREVFQLARERAPCVLFIDEIDAVGGRRTDDGTSSNREVERTLMQLLAELDGFEARGDVRIIAATNRADILDRALLRPGRFDRIIDVPLPSRDALRAILGIHTRDMRLGEDLDMDEVLDRLGAASGADIKAVCTEAGMLAVRHERDAVGQEDLLAAIERLHRGNLVSHATPPVADDLYA